MEQSEAIRELCERDLNRMMEIWDRTVEEVKEEVKEETNQKGLSLNDSKSQSKQGL